MISLKERSQIVAALPAFLVFGFVANLGMLVSPLFMMQLLDRVVPSGNMATLAMLLIISVVLIGISVIVDAKRFRIIREIGLWVERKCVDGLTPSNAAPQLQTISKLGHVSRFRQLMSVLDVPWAVMFTAILFALSPIFLLPLGIALIGMIFVEFVWGAKPSEADLAQAEVQARTKHAFQNLRQDRFTMKLEHNLLARIAGGLSQNVDRSFLDMRDEEKLQLFKNGLRQIAQISQLAIGGMLVSQSELTAGGMIAASLIGAKALSLSEAGIASLPALGSSAGLLAGATSAPMPLYDKVEGLSGDLRVENLTVPKGRTGGFRLKQVEFELKAGKCLAVLGASGSGKSTLLTYLTGGSEPPLGQISIGGHDLKRLDPLLKQQAIGFVPQAPVFDFGTIAENISCFEASNQSLDVERAAILAGVHSTILGLPDGYMTDLASQGYLLSAGQLQKLAIARAMYHGPSLLILDEPNSHQDNLGEQQIADALARVKASGCMIIMSVHRTGLLWLADNALILDRGVVADFGDRGSVLARHGRSNRVIDLPLTVGGVQDVEDWVTSQFQRTNDIEFKFRAVLVATELFNYMRALPINPDASVRTARLEFSFLNQASCEIKISEECSNEESLQNGALGLTENGKYLIGEASDQNNMSMVLLSQSADDLSFETPPGQTQITARLAA